VTDFVICTDVAGGVTVGHAVGELDAFNATEFRSKMEAIASSSRVVLDLGGVSFVDSAGLGVLIGAVRRVHELGGDVTLASPRPALERLLHDTGVLRIVRVAATTGGAIEALREQGPHLS
jgi:anti-sigma B factor antagonist